MSAPHFMVATAVGWAVYKLVSKKKRKKTADTAVDDPPAVDCGLYRWKPAEVYASLDSAIATGERNLERLALQAARDVYPTTPEGKPQPWPPRAEDERAQCILGHIRIRATRRLAAKGDDEGPGGSDPV